MLYYKFPMIITIDDVLPYIKYSPEFKVVDHGRYTHIDYQYIDAATFPAVRNEDHIFAKIRRECRGLIFDDKGRIVSRPFEKFFNMNEKAFTSETRLDVCDLATVAEKLDGSMVRPVLIDDEIIWMTRKGATDVARSAGKFLDSTVYGKDIKRFARACATLAVTPIFEYMSADVPIIVQHSHSSLILLAARNNFTGEYLTRVELMELIIDLGVDGVFLPYSAPVTMETLTYAKEEKDIEGYVATFMRDGRSARVKVKTEWYVNANKAINSLLLERNIFNMVVTSKYDDVLPSLPEEAREALQSKITCIHSTLEDVSHSIHQAYIATRAQSNKEIASINIVPTPYKSFIYTIRKTGASAEELVYKFVEKNSTSKRTFEKVERLLQDVREREEVC